MDPSACDLCSFAGICRLDDPAVPDDQPRPRLRLRTDKPRRSTPVLPEEAGPR